ncbi:hypothetical protein FA95DRAFT_1562702 [Auriscalpium vulgare]|uniref:Uncharacterized protein n=1 Tax=Auriscalpium vulgare TaxID=40419 RepID=A0ACB8RIE5_9AGAM|nr:hypothetical protein FA95DRAFT_1562702 [Auriscalpium vulgare]
MSEDEQWKVRRACQARRQWAFCPPFWELCTGIVVWVVERRRTSSKRRHLELLERTLKRSRQGHPGSGQHVHLEAFLAQECEQPEKLGDHLEAKSGLRTDSRRVNEDGAE